MPVLRGSRRADESFHSALSVLLARTVSERAIDVVLDPMDCSATRSQSASGPNSDTVRPSRYANSEHAAIDIFCSFSDFPVPYNCLPRQGTKVADELGNEIRMPIGFRRSHQIPRRQFVDSTSAEGFSFYAPFYSTMDCSGRYPL